MKAVTLFLSIFASFGVVIAQGPAADRGTTMKELKKSLLKYAPNVYDVDFDGCTAKIKITTRVNSYFSFSPSPSAGGHFPRDDSSSVLSAGPGNVNETRLNDRSIRYVLRLDELNALDVKVISHFQRNLSTIKIDGSDSRSIGILKKGMVTHKPELTIGIKQKSAEKVSAILRSLIASCER